MVTIEVNANIKMPDSCNVCPFINYEQDGYGEFCGYTCIFTDNEVLCDGEGIDERPSDCPIISIKESGP